MYCSDMINSINNWEEAKCLKSWKIIIPIIIVLLLIGGIAWEFMHFCKHTEKYILKKVNNKLQKCIKIILMTVLKTK